MLRQPPALGVCQRVQSLRCDLCADSLHSPPTGCRKRFAARSLPETALQEELKHGRAQQHRTELQRQIAAHEEAALAERSARAAEARSVLVRALPRAELSLQKQSLI